MAIRKYGRHTVYSGVDCAPGHVLVGDAMVPGCAEPGCTGWASRGGLCAEHGSRVRYVSDAAITRHHEETTMHNHDMRDAYANHLPGQWRRFRRVVAGFALVFAALAMLFGLYGCGVVITAVEIERGKAACAPFGGVRYQIPEYDHRWINVVCEDGKTIKHFAR